MQLQIKFCWIIQQAIWIYCNGLLSRIFFSSSQYFVVNVTSEANCCLQRKVMIICTLQPPANITSPGLSRAKQSGYSHTTVLHSSIYSSFSAVYTPQKLCSFDSKWIFYKYGSKTALQSTVSMSKRLSLPLLVQVPHVWEEEKQIIQI